MSVMTGLYPLIISVPAATVTTMARITSATCINYFLVCIRGLHPGGERWAAPLGVTQFFLIAP